MNDRIIFSFAIVVLTGFLGILAWKVARWDLTGVIVVTLALAVVDLISTTAAKRGGEP